MSEEQVESVEEEQPEVSSDEEPEIQYNLDNVPDIYETNGSETSGVALILAHTKFDEHLRLEDRLGSEKDVTKLTEVLENLGIEVRLEKDLTFLSILQVIDILSDDDHSKYDFFMMFIMTHGDDGKLAAYDMSYDIKYIFNKFNPEVCPTLNGKPKMFFIQACRGHSFDFGVQIQHIAFDAAATRSGDREILTYRIPKTADTLIMYSTHAGTKANRNPLTGSWFIQALCNELELNADSEHILEICRKVCKRVAYVYDAEAKTQDGEIRLLKQMPTIVSTLTKKFFFNKASITKYSKLCSLCKEKLSP